VIVQLTKMWLTNTATGEMLGAYSGPDRKKVHTVKGEVRTYAGGRQRAVGSLGTSSTWDFDLVELTAANVLTLRAWMDSGVTVLARDHRGQSMYGTFFGLEESEAKSQTWATALYAVSLIIQRVDVVEGV
jgi:hypothetical protein